MVGTPPFFYEFLEHLQNGGDPQDFRPSILGGSIVKDQPSRLATSKRSLRSDKIPIPKRKRRVSRYQKVFGKHLKALKRKHPRTNISTLMKKAHRLTKKEMK
jgi:hypothetical protein